MATQAVLLSGKCKWARIDKPNRYNKFSIVLYPDAESLEKIKMMMEKGIKNVLKKDEDGYNMEFKCDVSKNGRNFPPPPALIGDGELVQGLIGNGSDVTVKVDMYDYGIPHQKGRGYAVRLKSVYVHELVPYTRSNDFDDFLNASVKGLENAKEPVF